MNKINFANQIQVALFKNELTGQISDGMWENARPFDHYKVWCRAEVSINPLNVGVNFYAQKNNYNFTSQDLLSVVGDRMLNIANMTENGISLKDSGDFNDFGYSWASIKVEPYWKEKCARFIEVFGSEEGYKTACKGSYDMKKLKKELGEMKAIIRTFVK
jgi:hypothetical protein